MNANELADELDECEPYISKDQYLLTASATMLRQFGLAESIIKQQELRIAELEKQLEDAKDEMAEWQMSYENCHRMCNGYGMN